MSLKPAPESIEGPVSDFVFATCRAGSETAMKEQLGARRGEHFKPSFMRPQLLTFKCHRGRGADVILPTFFARVSGISLGMFSTEKEVAARIAETLAGKKPHLHVFPRVTPEDGVSQEEWQRIDRKRAAIMAALKEVDFAVNTAWRPADNDWVVDVIVGDEGEKMLLGAHRHGPRRHPQPGALPRLVLPPDAPSRSWLKMEQAIIFAGLDGPKALPGKNALELGCAPGGAAYSLLKRGVNVTGVDTGAIDRRVLAISGKPGCGRFTHLEMTAGDSLHADLPRPVHLLIADMNIAPQVMLTYIERLQSRVQARMLILTLKINDAAVRKGLPRLMKRIEAFAPSPVRAMQLPANREEICVVAGQLVHRPVSRVESSIA